jgi:hypothetical protein
VQLLKFYFTDVDIKNALLQKFKASLALLKIPGKRDIEAALKIIGAHTWTWRQAKNKLNSEVQRRRRLARK